MPFFHGIFAALMGMPFNFPVLGSFHRLNEQRNSARIWSEHYFFWNWFMLFPIIVLSQMKRPSFPRRCFAAFQGWKRDWNCSDKRLKPLRHKAFPFCRNYTIRAQPYQFADRHGFQRCGDCGSGGPWEYRHHLSVRAPFPFPPDRNGEQAGSGNDEWKDGSSKCQLKT